MLARSAAIGLVLAITSTVAGLLAGLGLIALLNAFVPFNYPDDDDTLREFIPVVLAYLTWAATGVLVFVVGWRLSRRWRQEGFEGGRR
jgi:hypothetical protein